MTFPSHFGLKHPFGCLKSFVSNLKWSYEFVQVATVSPQSFLRKALGYGCLKLEALLRNGNLYSRFSQVMVELA